MNNKNNIKAFFENITGFQYYLIYVVFNWISFGYIVIKYIPQDYFVLSSMAILFNIIPLIASYFRFKRLNFSNSLFIFWVFGTLLSLFYGVDFSNYQKTEEIWEVLEKQDRAFEVILSKLTGLVQLLFLIPMNLILLFKNAKREKKLTKEEEKIRDERNAKYISIAILSPIILIIIIYLVSLIYDLIFLFFE